jgi:hypothetical protein
MRPCALGNLVADPSLCEEGLRQNNDAKAARPNALVNLSTQAMPDPHFSFVKPNSDTQPSKRVA